MTRWSAAVASALVLVSDSGIMPWLPDQAIRPNGLVPLLLLADLAAVNLALLAAHVLTRRRIAHPLPIWVVCGIGAAAALVHEAVLVAWAITQEQVAIDPLPTAVAVLTTAATMAVVTPVVAFIVATRAWYTGERARLLQISVDREAARMRAIGALDAMRETVIETTTATVQTASERARALTEHAGADPVLVADALLDAAEHTRPAGHALAAHAEPALPRVRVRDVAAAAVVQTPAPLVPALLMPLLVAPRVYLNTGSVASMLLSAGALAAGIGITLSLLPRVRHRASPGSTVVACILAVIPAAALQDLVGGGAPFPALVAAMAPMTLLVVVAAAMPGTASASAEDVLSGIEATIAATEVERLAAERARAELQREIGLHLHGTVQSSLVAAGYAVQDAARRGDADALDAAIAQARSALALDVTPAAQARRGVADVVALIEEQWDGALTIDWHVADAVRAATAGTRLHDVLQECLANAVIHGHARAVRVDIDADHDTLHLRVEDDGAGPQGDPPGLGSMVLHEATAGDWELTRASAEGGAVVEARLPLAVSAG